MRFKYSYLGAALVFLFSVVGCGLEPVNFKPQFYAHDYKNQLIINSKNEKIYCSDEVFNGYASLSLRQIAELANILRVAKVPKRLKPKAIEIIKELESLKKQ